MLSMKCKLKKQKTKFGPSSMSGPCDDICMRLMLYIVQFCMGGNGQGAYFGNFFAL
jgi:hypothetical protein